MILKNCKILIDKKLVKKDILIECNLIKKIDDEIADLKKQIEEKSKDSVMKDGANTEIDDLKKKIKEAQDKKAELVNKSTLGTAAPDVAKSINDRDAERNGVDAIKDKDNKSDSTREEEQKKEKEKDAAKDKAEEEYQQKYKDAVAKQEQAQQEALDKKSEERKKIEDE